MPAILQAKTVSRALSFDISDKKGISSTGDCSSSPGASASQSGPSEVAAMMAAMTKMMTTQNEQMLQMQKLQTARERVKTPDGRARPKVAEDPGSGNPAARKRRPGSVKEPQLPQMKWKMQRNPNKISSQEEKTTYDKHGV